MKLFIARDTKTGNFIGVANQPGRTFKPRKKRGRNFAWLAVDKITAGIRDIYLCTSSGCLKIFRVKVKRCLFQIKG